MTKFTFNIPSPYVPELIAKLTKLARRAAKLRVPAPSWEFGEEYAVEDPPKSDRWRHYRPVSVWGEAPKYAGWAFVGTLEHSEAGNIVRCVPDAKLPKRFRTERPKCDHCKKTRRRNDTYVVRNEAGKYRQVGRQCLRDFLGHAAPEQIAQQLSYWKTFLAAMGDDEYGGGGSGPVLPGIVCYLSVVAAVIGEDGWMSRTAARATGSGSTADAAWNQIFPPLPRPKDFKPVQVTDAHRETAQAAVEWARTELAAKARRDEYEHNLMIAASKPAVTRRDAGIVASMIPAYERAQGAKVRAKYLGRVDVRGSEHRGEVDERQEFKLTLLETRKLETDFGTTVLHKFVDAEKNLYTWFSSSAELETQASYIIRGTVKRHTEFNGVKQTQLSRCLPVTFGQEDARKKRKVRKEAK